MKKSLTTLVLAGGLSLGLGMFPNQTHSEINFPFGSFCKSDKDMMVQLNNHDERPIMWGLTKEGLVMNVWVSEAHYTWSVTTTSPNKDSCIIAAGVFWKEEKYNAKDISNSKIVIAKGILGNAEGFLDLYVDEKDKWKLMYRTPFAIGSLLEGNSLERYNINKIGTEI